MLTDEKLARLRDAETAVLKAVAASASSISPVEVRALLEREHGMSADDVRTAIARLADRWLLDVDRNLRLRVPSAAALGDRGTLCDRVAGLAATLDADRERDRLEAELATLRARNAQLEANLLDYWAAHGAVKHIEEPRAVSELKARVASLEATTAWHLHAHKATCLERDAALKRVAELEAENAALCTANHEERTRRKEQRRREDASCLLRDYEDLLDSLRAALTPPGDGGSL